MQCDRILRLTLSWWLLKLLATSQKRHNRFDLRRRRILRVKIRSDFRQTETKTSSDIIAGNGRERFMIAIIFSENFFITA